MQARDLRIGRQVKQRQGIFMGAANEEVGFSYFPELLCTAIAAKYSHGRSKQRTEQTCIPPQRTARFVASCLQHVSQRAGY